LRRDRPLWYTDLVTGFEHFVCNASCLLQRWAIHRLTHVPGSPSKRRRAGGPSHAGNGATPPPTDNVSRVYNELRALIVSGQLPPGARAADRAAVAPTALSRPPVRGALHRLQQEGFVASVGRAVN